MWDVLWDRETSGKDVRTPDRQAALEQRLYSLIRMIKDPLVHTAYLRICRMQLSRFFWDLNRGPVGARKGGPSKFVDGHLKGEGQAQRLVLQKVVLGMLVQYPQFLEQKQDSLLRLRFDSDFEKFLSSLYRLLITECELSVQFIWDKLAPEYFRVLEEIHGRDGNERPSGRKLLRRFPILARDPPLDFVSRSMDHFIRVLHVSEIHQDIQRAELEAGEGDEAHVALLLNLVREYHSEQEIVSNEAQTLAEEAEIITRLWAPGRGTMALAA